MPASRKAKRAGVVGTPDVYELPAVDGFYWRWLIWVPDYEGMSVGAPRNKRYPSKAVATRAMVGAAKRLGIQLKGE